MNLVVATVVNFIILLDLLPYCWRSLSWDRDLGPIRAIIAPVPIETNFPDREDRKIINVLMHLL